MMLAKAISRCRGIRFKMTLGTFVLIALLTTGLSLLVIKVTDKFLLDELIARGASIAISAANPAGYSILSHDHLALDNLASKIESSQEDIGYVVIVDSHGKALGHSNLNAAGKPMASVGGKLLLTGEDFSVKKISLGLQTFYHFEAPIVFARKKVGEVRLGINASTLTSSQAEARETVLLLCLLTLFLGVAGTYFLSGYITSPVKRLSEGISNLKSGSDTVEVQVATRDELGELTRNFNEMARVIIDQKNDLALYARDLEESYLATVRILAASIDARDNYTLGHSARVANLSLLVGKKLGFSPEELKDLALSCFLHDLGKIRVPDYILKKTGPLNQEEFQCIQRHPENGAEILRLSQALHKYIPAVLHHHEWYNGGGYPAGLKGEEIPLFASVLALADSYDAMTTSRPYRAGLSMEDALAEMRKCRGTQFSPYLTDIFVDCIRNAEELEESPIESSILYGVA